MSYIGDFSLGSTFDTKFTTVSTTGAPTTLAGTPVISAYLDNSLTQLTAGITLTVDFDGVTGLHNVRVVATSGNGYATATNYQLVITTGTVGGTSVVGYVVAEFSIEARSSLRPTTAGRTLDVSATGEAGLDWANIGAPTTAQNLSATNIDVDQVVASVSGAVGSVTGAVGSVTGLTNATIADAVLDEDMTAHQTLGTLGQAIGDPVADTNTIYKAVVSDATGATVGVDVMAVKAETAAILTDTTEIGVAGAGLTNINLPNQTMDIVGNITGNLSGSVGSVTAGVTVAAGGIISGAHAAAELNTIADAVLDRNMATGTDSGTDSTAVRTPRQALRVLRNKATVAAGTLTVRKEDDATASFTAAITTTAGNPISEVDPT